MRANRWRAPRRTETDLDELDDLRLRGPGRIHLSQEARRALQAGRGHVIDMPAADPFAGEAAPRQMADIGCAHVGRARDVFVFNNFQSDLHFSFFLPFQDYDAELPAADGAA